MTAPLICRLSTVALQALLEETVAAQAGFEADGLDLQAEELNLTLDRIERELDARQWDHTETPEDTPSLDAPWWEAR